MRILLAQICRGRSTKYFINRFVSQVISEKTLCNKDFTSNLSDILHENNRNYNFHRFSYKFAFFSFLFFLTNLKEESNFQEVGSLVTRNISVLYIYV